MSLEERLKVQSGPFKGRPAQWFTRAQVIALLTACRACGGRKTLDLFGDGIQRPCTLCAPGVPTAAPTEPRPEPNQVWDGQAWVFPSKEAEAAWRAADEAWRQRTFGVRTDAQDHTEAMMRMARRWRSGHETDDSLRSYFRLFNDGVRGTLKEQPDA